MDCFSSTIHEYQPILVGAGCLALGYMYGRHCRSVMENRVADVGTMSDAACCIGTESFGYVPDEPAAAMVDPETMAIVRQWLNPAEAEWEFSDRELTEKPERCAKRDLEILPRKKEDMIWNQNVFKKQKSVPAAVRREVVRTKPKSDQDSDDERLVSRLEFFTKSSLSGTRASINKKKPTRPLGELHHHRHDVATSCCEEAKNFQEFTINTPRKGAARSLSGLGALASPQQQESSPGSSVEDTCRSPNTTVFLGDGEDEELQDVALERSCQVELANSVPRGGETESIVNGNCDLNCDCDFEQLAGCESKIVGLVGSKEQTLVENEDDESLPVRMEVDPQKKVDPAMRLELPTSPPPELLHGEQEGTGMGGKNVVASIVPTIQLLKIDNNEQLLQLPQASAANSGEKKKNKANTSSCFGAMPKPIRLQWFGKLTSSWRKKCKLWRRCCNKNQHQQQPSKKMALNAFVDKSQRELPDMVKPLEAPID